MKHKQNEDNKVYLLSSHPEIKLIFDVSTGVNFLHVFLHVYYFILFFFGFKIFYQSSL